MPWLLRIMVKWVTDVVVYTVLVTTGAVGKVAAGEKTAWDHWGEKQHQRGRSVKGKESMQGNYGFMGATGSYLCQVPWGTFPVIQSQCIFLEHKPISFLRSFSFPISCPCDCCNHLSHPTVQHWPGFEEGGRNKAGTPCAHGVKAQWRETLSCVLSAGWE